MDDHKFILFDLDQLGILATPIQELLDQLVHARPFMTSGFLTNHSLRETREVIGQSFWSSRARGYATVLIGRTKRDASCYELIRCGVQRDGFDTNEVLVVVAPHDDCQPSDVGMPTLIVQTQEELAALLQRLLATQPAMAA